VKTPYASNFIHITEDMLVPAMLFLPITNYLLQEKQLSLEKSKLRDSSGIDSNKPKL